MDNFKQSVYCTFQIDGVHNWSNIPNDEHLHDVQFLKLKHRHMFNFKCYAEVTHSDRDFEFIVLKRDVQDYLRDKYYNSKQRTHDFGSQSCEMLAIELLKEYEYLYRVEVNEDNENGGIVERYK